MARTNGKPLGVPNPLPSGDPDGVGNSQCRKDRDPNWTREEILVLVKAKREEYFEELDIIDTRDLMASDVSKWRRIVEKENSAVGREVVQEGSACKHKWQSILLDYKRIADFHNMTRRNGEEYFHLSFVERWQYNLPQSYYREVYEQMHEFMMHRPIMNPPHQRHLLRPGDSTYNHDQRQPTFS